MKRQLLQRLLLLMFLSTLLSAFATPQLTAYSQRAYLPLVSQVKGIGYNGVMPFGFETTAGHIREAQTLSRARELKAGWIRLNFVSWKAVQPTADSTYNWAALDYFEKDLKTALANGLTPIVGIKDSPHWAVKSTTRDGKPFLSGCAAIASEHFEDYANFVKALVQRYSAAPYGVRYWELGNEPDIDPTLIPADNTYGCWGDISDPYYGGRHYGEMLKVVYPAIKSVSPSSNVLTGGMLLDRPKGNIIGRGNPEKFFEGVLVAGGGDFFDIVAFHGYPWYRGSQVDSDLADERWAAWGGMTHGKVKFLRDMMAKYNIDKPLFYDEVALLVRPYHTTDSLKAHGDFLVKLMSRALNEGVIGVSWYTLNESGFFSSGLLDPNHEPRPAFNTYRTLIQNLGTAQSIQKFDDYGPNFEAYRYEMGSDRQVDVVWSTTNVEQSVIVPSNLLESVINRDGEEVKVEHTANFAIIPVGFSPVYIHRHVAPTSTGAPSVTSVSPGVVVGGQATTFEIVGEHFQDTPKILLGDHRLADVRMVDSGRLSATIPADMAAGTYDMLIINPDGTTVAYPGAISVRSPGVGIREVRPAIGSATQPTQLFVITDNAPGNSQVVLDTTALSTTRLSPSLLLASAPAQTFASGPVRLRDGDADVASLADGYSAPAVGDEDLHAYAYELSSDPPTMRQWQTSNLRLVVHRLNANEPIEDVHVRFMLSDPITGTLLGDATAAFAAGETVTVTTSVAWTPHASDAYVVYAVLDPEHKFQDLSYEDNIVRRVITVQPVMGDNTPPKIEKMRINNGAAVTMAPTVSITVTASDPGPSTGVRSVAFVEYLYNTGLNQWIPVQESGWMPLEGDKVSLRLVPIRGARVIMARVADGAGNISEESLQGSLIYEPSGTTSVHLSNLTSAPPYYVISSVPATMIDSSSRFTTYVSMTRR